MAHLNKNGNLKEDILEDDDRNRKSLMTINKTTGGFMSRTRTSEDVTVLKNAINEVLVDVKTVVGTEYSILEIDGNKDVLAPVSAVVFTMETADSDGLHIAAHIIIVESTMKTQKTKVIDVNNRSVEVVITPGDLYTEMFKRVKERIINAHTGEGLVTAYDAGCSVLHKNSELSPTLINNLVYTAVTSCGGILNPIIKAVPSFNVSDIDPKVDKLTAQIDYSRDNIEGYDLEPIRSDIKVDLNLTVPNGQVVELTTASSYIDLVYVPPSPPAYGQPPETQIYYPRQVITFLDTRVDALTLELQLLGLSQTTLLAQGLSWANQFKPKFFKEKQDITDIGAIGYELKIGDKANKINTKTKDFDDKAFYQLITMAIRDNLIISMDIDEVGGNSWLNQTFLAAAAGSEEANKLVINAANNLTNNEFKKVYDSNLPIAYDDNNRIFLGYYVDEVRGKVDLREIDLLAMLNLAGKSDPDLILLWDETFNDTSISMEVRLDTRLKCLKTFLPGNVVITGYARRITFEPKFLEALDYSLNKAGLRVLPSNVQQYTGDGVKRGLSDASRYAVHSNNVGSYFRYNGGYGDAGYSSYRGRFDR